MGGKYIWVTGNNQSFRMRLKMPRFCTFSYGTIKNCISLIINSKYSQPYIIKTYLSQSRQTDIKLLFWRIGDYVFSSSNVFFIRDWFSLVEKEQRLRFYDKSIFFYLNYLLFCIVFICGYSQYTVFDKHVYFSWLMQ